jgi:phosphatidylglycerol:prolipoprotein diacylglycerol transferase
MTDSAINTLSNNAINFPNIDPVLFKLGFFELRWYSLAYLVGIIGGWLYIMYMNRRAADNRLDAKMLDALPMWIVLGIVLGGRLGYVLFYNFSYYIQHPAEILQLWHGGMSFHGGLLGVIISAILFSRKYKIPFFAFTDLLAIATPIGLFLGRLANFVNGELYGRVTDWKYGVIFPGQFYPRHASQLYEAVLEGFVLFFVLMIASLKFNALKRIGLTSGIFMAGYAISRFTVEFFREPDAQMGYFADYFTMGQILCVPMFLFGIWLMLRAKKA